MPPESSVGAGEHHVIEHGRRIAVDTALAMRIQGSLDTEEVLAPGRASPAMLTVEEQIRSGVSVPPSPRP